MKLRDKVVGRRLKEIKLVEIFDFSEKVRLSDTFSINATKSATTITTVQTVTGTITLVF